MDKEVFILFSGFWCASVKCVHCYLLLYEKKIHSSQKCEKINWISVKSQVVASNHKAASQPTTDWFSTHQGKLNPKSIRIRFKSSVYLKLQYSVVDNNTLTNCSNPFWYRATVHEVAKLFEAILHCAMFFSWAHCTYCFQLKRKKIEGLALCH